MPVHECDRYLTAIHELVDGTLGPIRRAELELHLESCEDCRALAADLTAIARTARGLEQPAPPDRVWQNVAARLRAEGRVSAPSSMFSAPRSTALLALAAALVLAVAASIVLIRRMPAAPQSAAITVPPGQTAPAPDTAPATGNAAPANAVQDVVTQLAATEKSFQNLVEASQATNTVDPQTAATMQRQLLVMNEAIHETRKALDTDPQNASAQQSLYEVLKKKIQFLQDTIALMNEIRQGDAAGAAQIVESGKS